MLASMVKSTLLFATMIIILNISSSDASSSSALSVKSSTSSNKFVSVNAACSRKTILAMVVLREPFHGILYARGYPMECSVMGNGTKEVNLSFSSEDCGTKVIDKPDGSVQYDVYLYLQYERHVQQASDEVIQVQCVPQDVVVSSRMGHGKNKFDRNGMPPRFVTTQAPLQQFDSWMDILRGRMPSALPITEHVNVGEEVTMLVKVRHSNGVEAKVVDCVASDGTAENEQLLSDSNGCTVDAAIFPPLQEKTNSKTGIKMIHTTFPAFKFPERENLHLQCRVLVCNSTCPLESCSKSRWSTRGRTRATRTSSRNTVLREVEVFNTVEVRTPHIEKKTPTTSAASVKEPPTPRPDDIFCLNSARMVIIISILLGVLLVSLVVTICTCVRARELRRRLAQRQTFPYGKVHEYS